ncbi:MAG TPA: efflux RND transporter periplasmic adaptor subunit, partial [Verrucomicrobiae bacterium]|nr:efflux RND transporter periplasmic adaptor subunit [Verrucomicrobiae bacterium]
NPSDTSEFEPMPAFNFRRTGVPPDFIFHYLTLLPAIRIQAERARPQAGDSEVRDRPDACPTARFQLRDPLKIAVSRCRKKAIAGFTALIAIFAFTGCGQKHEVSSGAKLATMPVRVQTVKSTKRPAIEEVMGTVQAKLRATIEAKVPGRIEEMPVTLGQTVKTGDLLTKLDVREIQAKLDQAKATREQAERDFKRISALLEQQAVTQSEFDASKARSDVANAAVTEVESMLAYAKVVAPFDGVITRKLADVGDLAMPGKPLLEMENPNALRFVADVPDAISDRVKAGEQLNVRIGSRSEAITGEVSEISPAADPVNRTLQVKLDLPSTPGLKSGQFGRLEVPLAETDTIQVPASAVLQRGQMELVFVVKDARAQLRLVKTGKRSGDKVELLSGVSPGEQIVVEGATQLSDGQPVEVK